MPVSPEGFRTAIVEDNVLLKNTVATRKESFRRLRELYALDEETLLFRALRDLWEEDEEGQALLSLLCSTARDSILRGTAEFILSLPKEERVTPQMIEKARANAKKAGFKNIKYKLTYANLAWVVACEKLRSSR